MNANHSPTRRALLAATAAWLAVGPARAQTYPSRPVRLIVPAPAGTSPDIVARLWGERFARATGQAVVVDNKPGASTFLAAQAVAAAPADGHTLLYTVNSTFSINPFVFKKLPYKSEDFAPVTRMLSVPYVLLVSAQSRVRTLADLINEAKARPGQLNYSSGGVASGFHVATARLLNEAGVTMTHVPYKDYFMPDLIAQRIDVGFDASTGAIPQIRAGKVRALAVTSARRIEALPDVPAIAETFPGFVADSWHGLFAPRGTSDAVINTLVAQSQRIVDAPDFRAALRDFALTPVGGGAEAFRRFLADDAQTWAKVVRDNQITNE
ncbi:MAG: tripartite tricarboxylate transporter substrate binding protein [Hydrogenophaga sp.]|uniref:Bug family tripartite tricarboxylate transporter substrate binding protein n=1 Tax=Hydrogenophaga sp. TaxID=1904254 RepID=UPI002719B012|nr:tripartite tricarboxylate transporter substrate binding protein [Hydrogenophaga sp.]MDO9482700.1 tripartite tricarboxylate transporter substrate binding protein [Hydrogenophaga sp.]MDP3345849.1 tripartite tricarboxylate transporter substrate binding protein [Hydrogenophaga sp.]MDP3807736.1 tripartite tricarboxylate transporter substrate binding protein [Hydrogenophaga sp.]MDZ4125082.1 tripartite tricarboxylate transporter substrate binding protein [Hydrogenophaga sp.]MDZ4239007.1 tripartite